jgi:hypothetical protein
MYFGLLRRTIDSGCVPEWSFRLQRVIYSLAEVDPFSEASLSPTVYMLGVAYDVAPAESARYKSTSSGLGESATSMSSSTQQLVGPNSQSMSGSMLGASTMSQSSAVVSEGSRLFRHDMRSRFWFTYRCGLEPITAHGLTSDTGWGCMLRSAQMMFAQALMMHGLGRDWRLQPDLTYDQVC